MTASTTSPATTVIYQDADELWGGYDGSVLTLARDAGVRAVAELGGGANPIIGGDDWNFAETRVVFDISANELAKANSPVQTQVADLCKPVSDGQTSFDLVFSKMLCEHLPEARIFHENCFKLLKPGGLSVHFFPTLFAFPYVVNKLIPEETTRKIIDRLQPGRLENPNWEKFPAYYRWTTGPTKRAIRRFESVGFQVEAWYAAFGHGYYHVIPPLHKLEQAKSKFLLEHPVAGLTSWSKVVLRKPA